MRTKMSLILTALVALALAGVARAQAPTANGVNGSVGNSSPTAAMEGSSRSGRASTSRRAAPTYNGVNASVGNSSRRSAIEHSPHEQPPARK